MADQRIFRRIAGHSINADQDVVIALERSATGVVALLHTPGDDQWSETMPVAEAIERGRQALAAHAQATDYRELVVVDDDDLWDGAFGELVPHPTRMPAGGPLAG